MLSVAAKLVVVRDLVRRELFGDVLVATCCMVVTGMVSIGSRGGSCSCCGGPS